MMQRYLPILFSSPMAQAILDGRKSMTRRVLKPQPKAWHLGYMNIFENGVHKALLNGPDYPDGPDDEVTCPCQPGDILWVRETWCKLWALDACDQPIDGTEAFYYAADGYNPTPFNAFPDEDGFIGDRSCPKWRPSIFMPREVARLFLRVTAVRVERLQEINGQGHHDDVLKEGWPFENQGHTPVKDFMRLWDTLYAKRGYGWENNPWVWVYSFERCEKPEGWPL